MVYELECTVKDVSDISWQEYTRKVVLWEYESLFIFPEEESSIENVYESYNDIYFVDIEMIPVQIIVDSNSTFIGYYRFAWKTAGHKSYILLHRVV